MEIEYNKLLGKTPHIPFIDSEKLKALENVNVEGK